MLTKEDHINYWVNTASKDWIAVQQLFAGKSYVHSLFWAHLVLEKLLKAHWVKDNKENFPPKTHNLVKLVESTKLDITEDDKVFFYTINQFQLEGRYPDYIEGLHKKYKLVQTRNVIQKIDVIRKCLLKKLSSEN